MKYKIEVFDKNLNYKDFTTVDNISILNDYLTNDNITINTNFRNKKIESNDYVYITDYVGNYYFSGIILNYSNENNNESITIKNLINILNVETKVNISNTSILELYLKEKITNELITNEDNLQNIPFLNITTKTETINSFMFENEITTISNIIQLFFSISNIIVMLKLNIKNKTIDCIIEKNINPEKIIELNTKWIANLKIVDNEGIPVNKFIITNKLTNETKIFYKYIDNSIGVDNINRITPVNYKIEILETENFNEEATARATEVLTTTFNNNITFDIDKNNKLINVNNLKIGDKVKLKYNNKYINSILTGININNNIYNLEFGTIRISLTKLLKKGIK